MFPSLTWIQTPQKILNKICWSFKTRWNIVIIKTRKNLWNYVTMRHSCGFRIWPQSLHFICTLGLLLFSVPPCSCSQCYHVFVLSVTMFLFSVLQSSCSQSYHVLVLSVTMFLFCVVMFLFSLPPCSCSQCCHEKSLLVPRAIAWPNQWEVITAVLKPIICWFVL